MIDGRDIRQFDSLELRRLIGYVPQVPQFLLRHNRAEFAPR